ncbi:MAG TPA: class I SAM-dependent methyltransferase [Caulobacteraceae bacterium]|jgi:2-polyprenyl-3-methyl-5-hydroxy-6-metoxy-1,4-benzoquinol methylase
MNAVLDEVYEAKAAGYFANARREWVGPMAANPRAVVLELGCGSGATGALALREGKCGAWVGIERHGAAAAQAARVLSDVLVGDVDALDIPYAEASFDLLILGEVLEHLPDPEATLRRLARLVKPGGEVLASTPNISHWRIVAGLIAGRFDYQAEGVMDRTHLKWFTPRSLKRAFEQAGLADVCVRPWGWKRRSRALTAALPMAHLLWRQIEAHGVRAGP